MREGSEDHQEARSAQTGRCRSQGTPLFSHLGLRRNPSPYQSCRCMVPSPLPGLQAYYCSVIFRSIYMWTFSFLRFPLSLPHPGQAANSVIQCLREGAPRGRHRKKQQVFLEFVSQMSKLLGQWCSNPRVHPNHLEGRLKHS